MTLALSNQDFARHMRATRKHPLDPIPHGARVWAGCVALVHADRFLDTNADPDDILRSVVALLGTGLPGNPSMVLKVRTVTSTSGQQRTMISYWPDIHGIDVDFSRVPFVLRPDMRTWRQWSGSVDVISERKPTERDMLVALCDIPAIREIREVQVGDIDQKSRDTAVVSLTFWYLAPMDVAFHRHTLSLA